MDKSLYQKMIDILRQYMDLEVGNNLIWGHTQDFSTRMFNECGFDIDDWSWYDGPLVKVQNVTYPEIYVAYAACANTYAIHSEETYDNYLNITIEEVGNFASSEKKSKYSFDKISLLQTKSRQTVDYSDKISSLSPEFQTLVCNLLVWQETFDKTNEYQYSINIYIGSEVDVNGL